MNRLKSHTVLSIIAFLATNVFFVLGLLIDAIPSHNEIAVGLNFYYFFWISNGALLIISMASIGFKDFGDRLLAWGCSNGLRFVFVILLSVVIFVVAMTVLIGLHYFLAGSTKTTRDILVVLGSKYFISLTFYFMLISIMMFFISNLERRSGSAIRLMALSMGKVLQPKLTERGFMFIDLNGATTIAEKMQSQHYANLLRDCFRMLNDLVELSPFEIYQYVGDEAVITWKVDTENADLLALHLFSDFKAYLEENNRRFQKEYGLFPKFKCAIHSGEVVQSEIGKEIKHLVYHGDVLNTTSRLLAQCTVDTDMILSKQSVMNIVRLQQHYVLEQVAFKNLKGKEKEVLAYKVEDKKPDHYVESVKKQFFLEIKVTNSQKSLINKNSMKTIKNAIRLSLIALLFIACGDDGKKVEEENNESSQETASTTSQSNVQVVRRSDLELETIQNTTVSSYMPITGRVVPRNTTQLVSEVQGRILTGNKPIKAGTSYRKGEAIVRVDGQEFALNLESQKSSFLNILTGMMPDMKADYPDNYGTWLDYVNSYESGKPLPPLPETKSNSEKYFLTSRQVYNTYYTIKAQEERLSKYILRAPYDGSLSVSLVDNGGLVSPGQPLGTFISDKNYELESAVPLRLAKALTVGQLIEFHNKDLDKKFEAKVLRINNILDPNTQNIPVFLKISDPYLRSGMYLEGQVNSGTFENSVNVPAYAVNRDNTVHVLENGIIRKKEVDVLNTTNREVVIRGLNDNTQLVLTTFDNPVSGLKIKE